jgi:hypothetical protein
MARFAAAAAATPHGAVATAIQTVLLHSESDGGGLLDRLLRVITRLGGSVSPAEVRAFDLSPRLFKFRVVLRPDWGQHEPHVAATRLTSPCRPLSLVQSKEL